MKRGCLALALRLARGVLYRTDHFVSGSAAAAGGQASRHFCILGLSGEFKAMRWTSLASRRSARLEMGNCGGSVCTNSRMNLFNYHQ
jgi:hypothetical protein